MKEQEFLEKINDIDAELIEDRREEKRSASVLSPGRRTLRWIAVAAAALILFGGVTAYAVSRGISLSKVRMADEGGYDMDVELPKTAWSAFKGEIGEAPGIIMNQYATFTPPPMESSLLVLPEIWGRGFESADEAVDYIGLKGLKTPYFPYADYQCGVAVHGDEAGRVSQVVVTMTHVNAYEMGAFEDIVILTENYGGDVYSSGGRWTNEESWDSEFMDYTTDGGNECKIVKLVNPRNGRIALTGYVVSGPALYKLHLAFDPEEYARAEEIIHTWADGLD